MCKQATWEMTWSAVAVALAVIVHQQQQKLVCSKCSSDTFRQSLKMLFSHHSCVQCIRSSYDINAPYKSTLTLTFNQNLHKQVFVS